MKKRAFLFVVIAGVLWGTSGIFVNFLEPLGFTSPQMSAMRGTVSALCFITYALIKNKGLFRLSLSQLVLYIALGLSLFGTGTFYFTSMQMTSISTAVVLMYMAPVYVMVYSVLFFGERLTPLKGVAVGGMLVGCALVSGIIGGLKFDVIGIVFGLLSGIAYGAYNILTKIAMKKGCDPVSTTMFGATFMAVIALSVCDPVGLAVTAAKNPLISIVLIIGIGVATHVLPYFLYTLAMRELDAGTTAALAIIEPMSATLISIFVYTETPDEFTITGIVLIITSVLILSRTEGRDDKAKNN